MNTIINLGEIQTPILREMSKKKEQKKTSFICFHIKIQLITIFI